MFRINFNTLINVQERKKLQGAYKPDKKYTNKKKYLYSASSDKIFYDIKESNIQPLQQQVQSAKILSTQTLAIQPPS